MSILLESTTPIEILLKQALEESGLAFEEQHFIYERNGDLMPKYVADFVVSNGTKKIVVECDGEAYHNAESDRNRSVIRDNWLLTHGYNDVLHFNTHQLRTQMPTVILNIRHKLGIINASPEELAFERKKLRAPKINVAGKLHRVKLYYFSRQVKDKVYVVYRFYDKTKDYLSEERIKVYYNVPEKHANSLALLAALEDLKKSVEITIYCPSHWMVNHFSKTTEDDYSSDVILSKVANILKNHNYLFEYYKLKIKPSYHDYYETGTRIRELRSRCMQISHPNYKNDTIIPTDFSILASAMLN